MNGIVNGIATLIGLVLFIGIVWWAYSRGRAKANTEASLLPFALPDEEPVAEEPTDEPVAEDPAGDGESAEPRPKDKKQGNPHE